jgi:3-oxoacyl-[acyl-carrier protein] reductase
MFKDKVAIVTASGRGMGRAIVEDLAASGARVVICARTIQYGEQTLEEFRRAGYQAVLFQLDVTSHEAIRDLFAFTISTWGRVDIVVHCAAETSYSPIEHLSDGNMHAVFASIIDSSFWITQEAAKVMVPTPDGDGGRLIFISSVAGNRIAIPGMAHYGAAKSALGAMVRTAAVELATRNVTVNSIEPGLILTDRALSVLTPANVAALTRNIPVGRAGTNPDVVNAVRFLAAPASSYITGASILVDGGSTLAQPGTLGDALDAAP